MSIAGPISRQDLVLIDLAMQQALNRERLALIGAKVLLATVAITAIGLGRYLKNIVEMTEEKRSTGRAVGYGLVAAVVGVLGLFYTATQALSATFGGVQPLPDLRNWAWPIVAVIFLTVGVLLSRFNSWWVPTIAALSFFVSLLGLTIIASTSADVGVLATSTRLLASVEGVKVCERYLPATASYSAGQYYVVEEDAWGTPWFLLRPAAPWASPVRNVQGVTCAERSKAR